MLANFRHKWVVENMPGNLLKSPALCLPLLLSALGYFTIAYLLERNQFLIYFGIYSALFALYFWVYRCFARAANKKDDNYKIVTHLIFAGLLLRVLLVPVEPNLSDDYFRFYWDGLLNVQYISPYAYLPIDLIESNLAERFLLPDGLFDKLNSPKYFSVYPPLLQWIFMAAAFVAGSNNLLLFVVLIKCFILLFEAGSIYLILKILQYIKQPAYYALLYALNPLIILELTGNIHFEAALIFFTLLAFYLLYTKKRLIFSAFAMAGGIAAKLIPLIFLPFFIKRLGIKQAIKYGFLTSVGFFIISVLFIDPPIIKNLLESVGLYYNKFEFNASFYYIFRAIGYQIKGWNMIATIGKCTALATFFGILLMALFERDKGLSSLVKYALFALTFYLLLANIVHPWYVATLVAFAAISNFRYPILWSWLIGMSYFAYSNADYSENLFLIFLEYAFVLGVLVYEFVNYKVESVKSQKILS